MAAAFQLVVRQARVDGVRAVREAVAVLGYEPRTGGWLTRTVWEEAAVADGPAEAGGDAAPGWRRVAGVPGLLVSPAEPVTVAGLLRSLGDTRRSPATRRLWRSRRPRRRPATGEGGMSVVESEPAVEVDAASALAEAEEAARRRREADERGVPDGADADQGAAQRAPRPEPEEPAAPAAPGERGRKAGARAVDAGRAAAVVADLLALRGVGDKAVADLIVAQLGGAGVDVPRLVADIEAAQDRDRVSVAAETLAGQLRGVIEQVQRTAGASGAAVEVRLKEMEGLAYVLIQTALAAQSCLELAERSGGRVGTRLQDIVRAADEFLNTVGGAHAEVLAAEKAAGQWVADASAVGPRPVVVVARGRLRRRRARRLRLDVLLVGGAVADGPDRDRRGS